MQQTHCLILSFLICACSGSVLKEFAFKVDHNAPLKKFLAAAVHGEFATPPLCHYEMMKATDDNFTTELKHSWLSYAEYIDLMASRKVPIMEVTVAVLKVHKLVSVNERDKSIKLIMYAYKSWKDCRMRWNGTYVDDMILEPREFEQLNVFTPILETPEALTPMFPQGSAVNIVVESTGTVRAIYEFPVELSCNIEVDMYPFDIHVCSLTFQSNYHDWFVQMRAGSAYFKSDTLMMDYITSDVWGFNMLPPICAHACPSDDGGVHVECNCHKHKYRIILRRHPYYQLVNLLLPVSLIVFISSCVFLVPPNTGDKMNLCLAILLSLYFFCQLIYDKMPESGSTVSLISYYFIACIGLISACCVYAAISSMLFAAQPPVPMCLRRLVIALAPLLTPDMIVHKKHCAVRLRNSKVQAQRNVVAYTTGNALQVSSRVDRDRDREREQESVSEPEFASRIESDCGEQHHNRNFDGFHLDEPESLNWVAVGALFDRLFFVVHFLSGLAVLLYFVTIGYFSWSGYAKIRDTLSENDMTHLCVQLVMQDAHFDDMPCASLVNITAINDFKRMDH